MKLKIILLPPCSKKKLQKQTAKEYSCQSYFMLIKLAGLNVMSLLLFRRWSLITNDYIIIKFAYQLKN
jgi:hypothetical protein